VSEPTEPIDDTDRHPFCPYCDQPLDADDHLVRAIDMAIELADWTKVSDGRRREMLRVLTNWRQALRPTQVGTAAALGLDVARAALEGT
jgi:hypothetical protein